MLLSIKWRKTVRLALVFVLLFSVTVPFSHHSADAAHQEVGSRELVRIAAGGSHSLALDSDGTVVAWGNNAHGQSSVPDGLTGVMSVAAGGNHSLALKSDGTVVAWGFNFSGQTTIPNGLAGVVSIAAGEHHSLALKADGTVVAWGEDSNGESSVPGGLSEIVAVAAGDRHSLALKLDGSVVAWGKNAHGQTAVPNDLTGVIAIAAGSEHSLALKADGTVVTWGDNPSGDMTVPAGLTGVVSIDAGGYNSLALKSDGAVIAWGFNNAGQTIVPGGLRGAVAIAAGGIHTLALQADGAVVAWGSNYNGQTAIPAGLAAGLSSPIKGNGIAAGLGHSLALRSDGTVSGWGYGVGGASSVPTGLTGVVSLAAGRYHSLALQSNGTVVAWGSNNYGQLNVPAGLTGVTAIAAGGYHSLALKSDGTVVAWGGNGSGQSSVPAGLTGVVAIAAGDEHSLALLSDGTVVGWGADFLGQATAPAGLTDVVAIAAGWEHSLALKSDGTVVGWGINYDGQSTAPAGLSSVVAIAAGYSFSLALKSDGTVVGFGANAHGQLNMGGLSGVVAITAGAFHTLALKSDGTVAGFGRNDNSQRTIPGNNNLSALTLQEGAEFTENFQSSVTSYTYYYDGQSLSSVQITAKLPNGAQSELYVNKELVMSGDTVTINLGGAASDIDIPVRVEPYFLPGKTYTITLAIDSTVPDVQFGTNGRAEAAASASSAVTVSDTQSGVDADSLQYAWTRSTAVPTGGWSAFSDGDTLSQTSGDGNWYLHIRATDKVGNVVDKVSNAFVLDNTPPMAAVSSPASGTVNAAFPVTIAFNEDVNGFTEDDLVIGNGAVSDFVSVTSSTYTATINPTTSGQVVTVKVAAGAAADAAGNGNTESNILNVLYDTTKPVVTFGGFTDRQRFIAPPADVAISVTEAVYWIADGAELTPANALSLISMKKDGGVFAAYTPSFDELSRTFTLSFNDLLEDGDYEVLVAGNVVRNVNHNTLDATSASFTVAVPEITGISADPTSLTSSGGSTRVAITGSNLSGQTIKVHIDGVEAAAANVLSDTSAEATVTLPSNATQAVKDHLVTIYLNGVEVTGQSAVVSVNAAPPPPKSNNADLAALIVNVSGKELALWPAFKPDITSYTVETDAEQAELQWTAGDSKAVIQLADKPIDGTQAVDLKPGANVLVITVQAEDGTVKRYTLTIQRIVIDGPVSPSPGNGGTPGSGLPSDDGGLEQNEEESPSVPPASRACAFRDIKGHWAEFPICEAADKSIVEGDSVTVFRPQGLVTRVEFAAMMVRILGNSSGSEAVKLSFTDADKIPDWAQDAVSHAVEIGILEGYPDGTLRPQQTVSRSEMSAIMARAMKWEIDRTPTTPFADDADIPDWAKGYIHAAVQRGLLEGRESNTFIPYGQATRAEAAVVLLRLWNSLQ
ncbi:S-layer homology domain-containing protein [Paenibacillus nasutitermitis]|uniref:SLH domain-containing protein n=1 Tax=Paenibacillus nasutitermitis TaxID=1652958 RepID=A0A916ZGY2_9BACL|nr:S-layer homology domain-containing protein [Paenibacillus nasutitermitis]GGD97735.1 hypothetical protein GCM10010911_65630 [Paenibacillus nasutitermitis]